MVLIGLRLVHDLVVEQAHKLLVFGFKLANNSVHAFPFLKEFYASLCVALSPHLKVFNLRLPLFELTRNIFKFFTLPLVLVTKIFKFTLALRLHEICSGLGLGERP